MKTSSPPMMSGSLWTTCSLTVMRAFFTARLRRLKPDAARSALNHLLHHRPRALSPLIRHQQAGGGEVEADVGAVVVGFEGCYGFANLVGVGRRVVVGLDG